MKKKWSAVLCGIMAMAMMTSLSGCGGDSDSSSDADSSSAAEESSESDSESSDSDAEESSESDSDADSEDDETEEATGVTYGNYVVEAEDLDDACADAVHAYFTAIEMQDFEAYKETLYDYYYNVYNDYLQDNYEYGMETTMEQMHQSLLDSAGGDNLVITGISIKPSTIEDRITEESTTDEDSTEEDTTEESTTDEDATEEATEDLLTQYLAAYDSFLGDGFSDEMQKDVDQVLVVSFTMRGSVDGGDAQIIMEDYDLMMVEKDGSYYVLG